MTVPSTRTLCAVVINDYGDILPYSCQATKEQAEEWAQKNLSWDKMKKLGARVVQAELVTLE